MKTVIDLDPLLKEISPEAPSGAVDIARDPAYPEIEKSITEAFSSQPSMVEGQEGKRGAEHEGPNWQKIKKDTIELLKRGHHLRIATYLAQALLNTKGLPGFCTGLELINGYMMLYWGSFYPQLDPSENDDPTERINIFWDLSEGNEIIESLKKATLYSPQPMVQISLRTIHIANGKIASKEEDEDSSASPQMIEEAFKDCDVEELMDTRETIKNTINSLKRMESLLKDRVGSEDLPNYLKLYATLEEMADFFDTRLPDKSDSNRTIEDDEGTLGDEDNREMPTASDGKQSDNIMQTITNRKDVIRLLDQICTYYDQNEPASPVPLLLKRARQLVEKNFLEIVQDLAPDSAGQIQALIGGATNEEG